jgi:hypothetical protein
VLLYPLNTAQHHSAQHSTTPHRNAPHCIRGDYDSLLLVGSFAFCHRLFLNLLDIPAHPRPDRPSSASFLFPFSWPPRPIYQYSFWILPCSLDISSPAAPLLSSFSGFSRRLAYKLQRYQPIDIPHNQNQWENIQQPTLFIEPYQSLRTEKGKGVYFQHNTQEQGVTETQGDCSTKCLDCPAYLLHITQAACRRLIVPALSLVARRGPPTPSHLTMASEGETMLLQLSTSAPTSAATNTSAPTSGTPPTAATDSQGPNGEWESVDWDTNIVPSVSSTIPSKRPGCFNEPKDSAEYEATGAGAGAGPGRYVKLPAAPTHHK